MPSTPELIAGISSTITRLSAFGFLRWIPGHHFPPVVITSVLVYLICIFGRSDAFGTNRLTLHEAFPKLFPERADDQQTTEQKPDAVDDVDEPIIYDDERSFLKIICLGIPNWREGQWSFLSIGVNVMLALFTLDLVFRGPLLYPSADLRFSRVGYVDATSAKVLFREPDSSQLPLYVYLSPADKTNWVTTETVYYVGEDTDYTYPITFTNLEPSRKYIYSLSNDLSGTFTTAPSQYSAGASSLTFLTSSCIKASFPYKPESHALAIHGFKHLSTIIQSLPSPAAFMLFLGDFIYIDVPLRLSSSVAHYRAEYRRLYASPSWSLPGLDLPWYHTLDDHEIANDWSGGNDTSPFPQASDPFIHYHVSVNPPIPPGNVQASRHGEFGEDTNTTYFQFTRGPASFFMLDTRRYRTDPEPQPAPSSPADADESSPTTTPSNHSMLGPAQLSSLLTFLSTPPAPSVHFYIIASSVPFTKNWRFGTPDTWGGFLAERTRILHAMHAAERTYGIRVIILSGDRHEFAAIRYPPPIATLQSDTIHDRTPAAGPHEFSVGPLSMFYLPFRTFRQIDDEDVALAYLPDGNSKVGVIDVRNLGGGGGGDQRSILSYRLFIDGALRWEYTLTSPGRAYLEKQARSGWRRLGRGLWE